MLSGLNIPFFRYTINKLWFAVISGQIKSPDLEQGFQVLLRDKSQTKFTILTVYRQRP
jgi:hypothetical protein